VPGLPQLLAKRFADRRSKLSQDLYVSTGLVVGRSRPGGGGGEGAPPRGLKRVPATGLAGARSSEKKTVRGKNNRHSRFFSGRGRFSRTLGHRVLSLGAGCWALALAAVTDAVTPWIGQAKSARSNSTTQSQLSCL
jgi:hypothetical protein